VTTWLSLCGHCREISIAWSHDTRLLRLQSGYAVEFYHAEAVRGGWTVKQLERQMNSQFDERTALSRNKTVMPVKGQRRLPEDKVSVDEKFGIRSFWNFLA